MNKPKARKVRKPMTLAKYAIIYAEVEPSYGFLATVSHQNIGSKEARRLAKWLLQFADWAEQKAKRK